MLMELPLKNLLKTLLVLSVLTYTSCQKPDDAFNISQLEH